MEDLRNQRIGSVALICGTGHPNRTIIDEVTRYTVRGRGAKHFFPSGSAPGGSLPEAERIIRSRTSVQRPLIWCPNSHLVRSIMSMLRFWKFSSKSRKIRVRKRSLNRLIVFVSFINGDPLSDRSKSKVQTTSRQEPCHTPRSPSQKSIIFRRTTNGHQFFVTTGWKERFAQ